MQDEYLKNKVDSGYAVSLSKVNKCKKSCNHEIPIVGTEMTSLLSNRKNKVEQGVSCFNKFLLSPKSCTPTTYYSHAKKVGSDITHEGTLFNSFPTILKKSFKDKKHVVGESPVKSLMFSPSRFLNARLNNSNKADFDFSSDTSCQFGAVEDSGIVISDLSSDLLTSPQPSKCFQHTSHSELSLFNSENEENFCCPFISPLQSTPKNNDKIVENQTPLIQKFLNESVLQTPSPFKCPDIKDRKLEIGEQSTSLSCINYEQNSGKTSPLQITKAQLKNFKKKTVRKALIRHQTFRYGKDKSCKSPLEENCLSSFVKMSNLPIKHCRKELPFDKFNDRSTLVEQSTVVKKRKITPMKSVFYTKRFRKSSSIVLNNHWVSIACGQSSDQKDMAAAARRYLDQR